LNHLTVPFAIAKPLRKGSVKLRNYLATIG
jgi:hypothetical protein